MTPEQFTYWLQGFVELSGIGDQIDSAKWRMIKDHLQEVFKKQTPVYTPQRNSPNEIQRQSCTCGQSNVICPVHGWHGNQPHFIC